MDTISSNLAIVQVMAWCEQVVKHYIDDLVQERRNSSALHYPVDMYRSGTSSLIPFLWRKYVTMS